VNRLKSLIKKIDWAYVAKLAVVTLVLVVPVLASAQLRVPTAPGGVATNARSLPELIQWVINLLLALSGLIALLFLIIGGFWYITSAGNAETAEKGKTTVINAIIGLVIIALSWVIVTVVIDFLTRQQ
jgi:hypothetical protein